jgi:hypothetical protein
MADLIGFSGERKEFKYVGPPQFSPGKLSYNLATGKT